MPPKALTIAGSDSGGGAGIQADLKTFCALGVHGSSVITALTAQNTVGVQGIWTPPAEFIFQQFESIMTDIGADAAKTGMLANADNIASLLRGLDRWPVERLVVDPVMVATSGDLLLEEEARDLIRKGLLPRAYLVTPNLPEAKVLTDLDARDEKGMRESAERIFAMGPRAVLVKGGHLPDSETCHDVLFDGREHRIIPGRRIAGIKAHGAGCTLSAGITAYLARGESLVDAVTHGKRFTERAIELARSIGHGAVPLNHGWQADAQQKPQK